jgi:cell division septation protein DedD
VKTQNADRLPAVSKKGEWVVQVFSSQSAADAGLLRDKLGNMGYPAFITEADLGKKGIWYRVLFGPYLDKESAIQAQAYAGAKDKLNGFAKRR